MRMSGTGWAVSLVSSGLVAFIAPESPDLVADLGGDSFPDALVAVGSLIALALAGWSLLVAIVVVLGGSSRIVFALTPAFMRRALLAGAVGAMVAAPAYAETRVLPDAQRHSVVGLPLPDRPAVVPAATPHTPEPPTSLPAAPAAPATPATPAAPAAPVTPPASSDARVDVRPGDTLWAIAARSLPPDATAGDIARATAQWHESNRDVIGDDPDLIFPTQRLAPPTGKDLP